MEMYLQFGHGMMGHTRELLENWGGGGVILSPRDLTSDQLQRIATDIIKRHGEPLLDPQCFAKDADHVRLVSHDYWKIFKTSPSGAFFGGPATADLLKELATQARLLGVRQHILPGRLANPVSEDWFAFQENLIAEAPTHFGGEPILATIALSNDAMRHEDQVEAETPTAYLVDDPGWLANLLILASGLKLLGKRVIVGYCSHQMLCLAAANVDIVAAGTWLNVRAFPPEKFYAPADDDISRRTTWYYCPQALSEYRLPFLDIAQRAGILDEMRPNPSLGSSYADPLFRAATPSSVIWGEQDAFRHYLTCLHSQVAQVRKSSFDATVDEHFRLLSSAEGIIKKFRQNGVFGGDRDFKDAVDVNRSAMTTFVKARGPRLRRSWL